MLAGWLNFCLVTRGIVQKATKSDSTPGIAVSQYLCLESMKTAIPQKKFKMTR